MDKIRRGDYWFIGPRASDSAKYYDLVISHGYNGDLLYLAWEAAHKFGQKMIGPQVVSYRDGVVCGERADEAALFIDQKYSELFALLPQENRKKTLSVKMQEYYLLAEQRYGVSFIRM